MQECSKCLLCYYLGHWLRILCLKGYKRANNQYYCASEKMGNLKISRIQNTISIYR